MKYWSLLLCLLPVALMQSPTLDISQLIKDCQANGQNGSLMTEYTYNWKITQRGTNGKGVYKDEYALYETYVPTLKNKGTTKFVLIQTHEKSQPLPLEKIEKERQKAGERLARAEAENQRENTKEIPSNDENRRLLPGVYFDANVNFGLTKNVKLSPQTILKQCVFDNPREEMLNSRPVIKLDFRPSATAVFEKDQQFLARARGTLWIDKTDRIVVKIEGRKLDTKPNDDEVVFLYQSIRTPEGKWLPQRVQFNGSKNKEFFNGMGGDMIFEWLDYKRFVTDAEDAKIKSPK